MAEQPDVAQLAVTLATLVQQQQQFFEQSERRHLILEQRASCTENSSSAGACTRRTRWVGRVGETSAGAQRRCGVGEATGCAT